MPDDSTLKRYRDAGRTFTADARAKVQSIVDDLVARGELQADQAQALVNDIVAASLEGTESLLQAIREEIEKLGLAGREQVEALEKQVAELSRRVAASGRGRPAQKAARKTPAKKKAAKKKAPAKKAAAKKKAATKKAAARKKAPAKKKAAAKRAPAKKRAAKKTAAKKA